MDPLTITLILTFLWVSLYGGGYRIYHHKVLVPRREESKRLMLESMKAEQLAIEMKREQDAALTLEDKIWLFDMGRTEWSPEKELGFIPEFNGTNVTIYYDECRDRFTATKAHLWDLPDWYVDFLTTRPLHSDLSQHFYNWAAKGIDPKTRLAEMKQERDKREAKLKADEAEKKRRYREWLEEQRREEQEEVARRKAARIVEEKRQAEERKKRALELEEKRRGNLGLTGTYIDEVVAIYKRHRHEWDAVGAGNRIVRFAPRTSASLAIKQLQETFGLPVTGNIDADTLYEMEVQSDVMDYVGNQPKLRVVSDLQKAGILTTGEARDSIINTQLRRVAREWA